MSSERRKILVNCPQAQCCSVPLMLGMLSNLILETRTEISSRFDPTELSVGRFDFVKHLILSLRCQVVFPYLYYFEIYRTKISTCRHELRPNKASPAAQRPPSPVTVNTATDTCSQSELKAFDVLQWQHSCIPTGTSGIHHSGEAAQPVSLLSVRSARCSGKLSAISSRS